MYIYMCVCKNGIYTITIYYNHNLIYTYTYTVSTSNCIYLYIYVCMEGSVLPFRILSPTMTSKNQVRFPWISLNFA